ncbi:MAG: sulfotransferase [Anaerolineae bacterium]|nr:sulfotransferase [Anaerolineae bacterium]
MTKPWNDRIVVVSGLPRSGTSLMMQMLDAGGIAPLTDYERTADEDNPKGYYEFERAKKLPEGDTDWLEGAAGMVVKVITALLVSLPNDHEYDVIMMRREMGELLASQQKMLERRGVSENKISDEVMAASFEKHLDGVYEWMRGRENLRFIDVPYDRLVLDTEAQIIRLVDFLGDGLDTGAMAQVVSPELYRQRTG